MTLEFYYILQISQAQKQQKWYFFKRKNCPSSKLEQSCLADTEKKLQNVFFDIFHNVVTVLFFYPAELEIR